MKPQLLLQDFDLLRRTVTEKLSDDEHQLFVLACKRSGLDPFARHLYWTRQRGEFKIEATIDGFRFAAEQTKEYAGQIGPHWCGPDGIWKAIWTEKQPPTAARVGILRKDFQKPIWGKAVYSEFSQGGEFWREMPSNQLAKCAEAQAFRKAFPAQLSGLYTSDELSSAAASSDARPLLRPSVETGPERGAITLDCPLPLPLQPFLSDLSQRGIAAANAFIAGELEHKLGDQGRRIFNYTMARYRRAYKSREEARAATFQMWRELWEQVERDARESEAA